MPDLPTLTINDPVIYQRVVDAFNASPAQYRAWLRDRLKEYVIAHEVDAMKQDAVQQWAQRKQELTDLLDGNFSRAVSDNAGVTDTTTLG